MAAATTQQLPTHPFASEVDIEAEEKANLISAEQTQKVYVPFSDYGAYIVGQFFRAFVNNASGIVFLLLTYEYTQSTYLTAYFDTVMTAMAMGGLFLTSFFSAYADPRILLAIATLVRAFSLAAVATIYWMEFPCCGGLYAIAACYFIEGLGKGVTRGARRSVPLFLVGENQDALLLVNSRSRLVSDIGRVLGPWIPAALMNWQGHMRYAVLAPVIPLFVASGCFALLIPKKDDVVKEKLKHKRTKLSDMKTALTAVVQDSWLSTVFCSLFLSKTLDVKRILPLAVAVCILQDKYTTAWMMAMWSLGSMIAAITLSWIVPTRGSWRAPIWIVNFGVGAGLIGWGWVPTRDTVNTLGDYAFIPYGLCVAYLAFSRSTCYVTLTSVIQAKLHKAAASPILALSGFVDHSLILALKLSLSIILHVHKCAQSAFVHVGILLSCIGCLSVVLGIRLSWIYKKNRRRGV